MSNISKNLAIVQQKIKNAYLNRPVELQSREPRLVAVSKTKPKECIVEAYNSGQRHFGENYVEELLEKAFDEELVKACPEIKWHFIGHLQRNKVGKLLSVPNLYIVESVDTQKLAEALNTRVEKFRKTPDAKLDIFIQVNTSGEDVKSGCEPNKATDLVKYTVENCKNLNVKGLMTIGKYDNYSAKEGINPDFKTLIDCRHTVSKDLGFDENKLELSMGMSGDFEHAVEVGATNVRVGSLIFDGDVKLLTTQCIIKEMEKLGPATFGALLIIKKFGIHQCGHAKSPIPASDCILLMIGENNSSRYIIASQDREIQQKCRSIQGVPLLYLHSKTPVLEPPSPLTQETAYEKTLGSVSVNEFERQKLTLLNKDEGRVAVVRQKRKRKGGPNPLSCKKKKRKPEETTTPKNTNTNKKKRKRNRNRLVKRIKNEILDSLNS